MSLENLFISLEAIYFIMRECPRVVLRTLGPRCSLIGLRSRRRVTPEGDKGQTVNPNCLKFLRAVDCGPHLLVYQPPLECPEHNSDQKNVPKRMCCLNIFQSFLFFFRTAVQYCCCSES